MNDSSIDKWLDKADKINQFNKQNYDFIIIVLNFIFIIYSLIFFQPVILIISFLVLSCLLVSFQIEIKAIDPHLEKVGQLFSEHQDREKLSAANKLIEILASFNHWLGISAGILSVLNVIVIIFNMVIFGSGQ